MTLFNYFASSEMSRERVAGWRRAKKFQSSADGSEIARVDSRITNSGATR
jgi:hypothetical protein